MKWVLIILALFVSCLTQCDVRCADTVQVVVQCTVQQTNWERERGEKKELKTIINLIKSSSIETVQWINCWNCVSCANWIRTNNAAKGSRDKSQITVCNRALSNGAELVRCCFFSFSFHFRLISFMFIFIFELLYFFRFNGPSKFYRFLCFANIHTFHVSCIGASLYSMPAYYERSILTQNVLIIYFWYFNFFFYFYFEKKMHELETLELHKFRHFIYIREPRTWSKHAYNYDPLNRTSIAKTNNNARKKKNNHQKQQQNDCSYAYRPCKCWVAS